MSLTSKLVLYSYFRAMKSLGVILLLIWFTLGIVTAIPVDPTLSGKEIDLDQSSDGVISTDNQTFTSVQGADMSLSNNDYSDFSNYRLLTKISADENLESIAQELRRRFLVLYFYKNVIESAEQLDVYTDYLLRKQVSEYRNSLLKNGWKPRTIIRFGSRSANDAINDVYYKISLNENGVQTIESLNCLPEGQGDTMVVIPKIIGAKVDIATTYSDRYKSSYKSQNDQNLLNENDIKLILTFHKSVSTSITAQLETIHTGRAMRNVPLLFVSNEVLPGQIKGGVEGEEIEAQSVHLIFYGIHVEASVRSVNINCNEEELRNIFLQWKQNIDFLETHQIIAFHFSPFGAEPENRDAIFRDVFGYQPVTYHTFGNRTKVGRSWPAKMCIKQEITFGPQYAIVGFKKFVTTKTDQNVIEYMLSYLLTN
ncbi:unnamed protein product [Thelazia callipaeda]|uniref:Thioredoxin domain-containing protein n=1 Tax=Thelazia callipaeda TaxID=103827 RepID=A0A0N5CXX1_THECL|nr:unnamed protein product [Thelazia callipaeda]